MSKEREFVYLTKEGLTKLEDELTFLRGAKRREIAERIKVALEFGDISENSEYDEAKTEQGNVEQRILVIENMLKKVVEIDESQVSTEIVGLGSVVEIYDMDYDEKIEYLIVGSQEASPRENKISNESPVGKALINKKQFDEVEVQIPDGISRLRILNIKRKQRPQKQD